MARSVLSCASCLRRLVLPPLIGRRLPETTTAHYVRLRNDIRWFRGTSGLELREIQGIKRRGEEFSTTEQSSPSPGQGPVPTTTTKEEFEQAMAEMEPRTEEEAQSIQQKRTKDVAMLWAHQKLKVIDDPYHIAQAVSNALKLGSFEKALTLTEKASRTMSVVVSWNMLIEYQLSKGEIKTALKTYNNMKKRGQLPNVQTFTTIFSGLMNATNPHAAVVAAVKLYNLLLQDTRLDANIFHTNAVLRLCSHANDLDQMLLIADTLDNKTRRPDATTYTILLEGIRHKVKAEVQTLTGEESQRYRKEMFEKAMVLWSEVTTKWSEGRLKVDEWLVVAMARTFPFRVEKPVRRAENNQILDLLYEMMNIPNFAKYPDWNTTEAERLEAEPGQLDPNGRTMLPEKLFVEQRGNIVKPGARTMGLILEVLGAERRSVLAIKYWNKLVDDFGVRPDPNNYFRMLVLLKASKASVHVAWLLKHTPSEWLHPGHFNIAMEACVSDNINRNAIENAKTVLDRANEVLPQSAKEMMKLHRQYLRVALVSHHFLRQQSARGEMASARKAYARQILKALDNLWPLYHKLHQYWFEVAPQQAVNEPKASAGKPGSSEQANQTGPISHGQCRNAQREVIALARNMYAAYNKITTEEMLPAAELRPVHQQAAAINREIQRFYSDRAEHEPNLPALKEDDGTRTGKRKGRLQGDVIRSARLAALSGVEEQQKSGDAAAVTDEADRLAEETAPPEQDGLRRVAGEFVWDTRKPPPPPKKQKSSGRQPARGRKSGRGNDANDKPRGSARWLADSKLHRANKAGSAEGRRSDVEVARLIRNDMTGKETAALRKELARDARKESRW